MLKNTSQEEPGIDNSPVFLVKKTRTMIEYKNQRKKGGRQDSE